MAKIRLQKYNKIKCIYDGWCICSHFAIRTLFFDPKLVSSCNLNNYITTFIYDLFINFDFCSGNGPTESFSTTSKVIISSVYAITIAFGLLGNTLSLHLVFKKKAGNRTTNMLIANMAFADLLVTIFAMPYSLIYLYIGVKWIGEIVGQITCKVVHFSYQVSIPASILTVMVVSLDRFFAILYPLRGRVLRQVKTTTAVIWILSVAYAIPFKMANDIYERNGTFYCIRVFTPFNNEKSRQIYYLITFIFLYCIPLLILLVLYTFISRKLWQRKIPGNVSEARERSTEEEKRRIIKALIAIVVVFAVSWFPAHIMHYLVYFRKDVYLMIPPELEIFFFWLSHANSVINPCLYVLLSRGYRQEMRRFLQRSCFCCRRAKGLSIRRNRSKTSSMNPSGSPSLVVGFTFKSSETVCTRL